MRHHQFVTWTVIASAESISGIHAPVGNSDTHEFSFRKFAQMRCGVPWFVDYVELK